MKPLKLITILGIAIFMCLPYLAFAKGKPVKPPADDAVVYTVELTEGVFNFPPRDVTMNSREYLNSLDAGQLVIERDDSVAQDIWDDVIKNCAGFMSTHVEFILIDFDEWVVGRNGDDGTLYINLKTIRLPSAEFPEKEIQIILRLINEPDTTAIYPPTEGNNVQTFWLYSYVIWGKPLTGKGKKGWVTCYHSEQLPYKEPGFPTAKLEITYNGAGN